MHEATLEWKIAEALSDDGLEVAKLEGEDLSEDGSYGCLVTVEGDVYRVTITAEDNDG